MVLTIVNGIWFIICVLGIINFFVGNGGIGSLCISIPLILGSIVYGILLNCFLFGVLIASLIGGIIILVVFFFLANKIKPKDNKETVKPEEKEKETTIK